MNDGANVLAVESKLDVSFLLKIKNDDGNVIVDVETKGCGIHDAELTADTLLE